MLAKQLIAFLVATASLSMAFAHGEADDTDVAVSACGTIVTDADETVLFFKVKSGVMFRVPKMKASPLPGIAPFRDVGFAPPPEQPTTPFSSGELIPLKAQNKKLLAAKKNKMFRYDACVAGVMEDVLTENGLAKQELDVIQNIYTAPHEIGERVSD